MGREIRRVPPNWKHPKRKCPHESWAGRCSEARENDGACSIPLYDKEYEVAARDWLNECIAWDNGTHPNLLEHTERKKEYPFFWQWNGNPPDPNYYRPAFSEEPTWWQVYETVSEGTPVSPPFETKEELINYLVEYGDYWDQREHRGGWLRANAEKFVDCGWAPSIMVVRTAQQTQVIEPRDGA